MLESEGWCWVVSDIDFEEEEVLIVEARWYLLILTAFWNGL